jgi:hypothetical protein
MPMPVVLTDPEPPKERKFVPVPVTEAGVLRVIWVGLSTDATVRVPVMPGPVTFWPTNKPVVLTMVTTPDAAVSTPGSTWVLVPFARMVVPVPEITGRVRAEAPLFTIRELMVTPGLVFVVTKRL